MQETAESNIVHVTLQKSSWGWGHPSQEVCWVTAVSLLSFAFLSVFMPLFIRQIIRKCLLT